MNEGVDPTKVVARVRGVDAIGDWGGKEAAKREAFGKGVQWGGDASWQGCGEKEGDRADRTHWAQPRARDLESGNGALKMYACVCGRR